MSDRIGSNPPFNTIVDLLRFRVEEQPEAKSFTFLADGEHEAASLTYFELFRHARAIARRLQERNGKGERALMLYDTGPELVCAFYACLLANVIAVPLPPPVPTHKHRYLPRLLNVIDDADARFVLTTTALLTECGDIFGQHRHLLKKEWVITDLDTADEADDWKYDPEEPEALAYLQYTSGSTSTPKGVMISHANLMKICDYDAKIFDFRPNTTTVCWMPYFHDYGLFEGLVFPVYHGNHSILMPPSQFVYRPIRWLRAISRYQASHSSGPNFAYELCVRKTSAQQREGLDLHCWTSATSGGEPIRIKTLEQFITIYEPFGFSRERFLPVWGLAESTLGITGGLGPRYYPVSSAALSQGRIAEVVNAGDKRILIGCGEFLHGVYGTQVAIVDPQTLTRVPRNEIGEIWISGDLVAKGYWNKPVETQEVFRGYIADTGEGPFLRTGDLGFIKDGEVVFTGRLKDLIICEGRNHYPQDIEITAEESHPSLRPGSSIAFSVDAETEERVVLVAEINRDTDPEQQGTIDVDDIKKRIRSSITEVHGLRVHDVVLVRTGSIPKTSSGKLQRAICRTRYLEGDLDLWPKVFEPLDSTGVIAETGRNLTGD